MMTKIWKCRNIIIIIFTFTQRGQTPLHLASMHNLVAGVRALIEHSADPNIVDKVCCL